MMIRRALVGFTGVVVAAVVAACAFSYASAQKREPMPRVGMLTPAPTATAKPLWDAFRETMKELGYVEGKTVVYEYRSAEGQLDRLPQLAAELVKIPVKVMVVANTPANLAAKRATTTIPKGAKPGELPVQQPTKLELAVNLKTTAALSFEVPQAILVQADRVIE